MRSTSRERGYTTAWDKARKGYLKSHRYCVMCVSMGINTQATVVDHIKPHRGDQGLFWNKSNWQSLCATHHSSSKQREERSGRMTGTRADGSPLDAGHHWNR